MYAEVLSLSLFLIDQSLGWDEHVDSLCKRVSSGLAGLKQARRYVPQNTLITI